MSFFDTYVVMKVSLKILLTWSKMLSRLQITRLNRQDEFFFHFWDKSKPNPFWGGAQITVCPVKINTLSSTEPLREERSVQVEAGLCFCCSRSGEIRLRMTLLSKDRVAFVSIRVYGEAFSELAEFTGKSLHFPLHLFENNMTLLITNLYACWLSRDVLL